MSTTQAALAALFVVVVGMPVVYRKIACAQRVVESERDRIIREARSCTRVWDVDAKQWVNLPAGIAPGPGQMTSHDIAEADPLELLWAAPAYDAELAAGCDRLWDAVRDEQNGDTP